MKNSYSCLLLIGAILVSLTHFLFGEVRSGHAQSFREWSDPINVSNSGSAFAPLFIVDTQGGFHIIWFDLYDGYKYSESKDGVTWTNAKNVTFPFSPQKSPQSTFSLEELSRPKIVPDSQGSLHIFWQDNKKSLHYSRVLPEELDNRAAWGDIKIADSAIDLDVAVDPTGNVHVGYLRNISTEAASAGIYYTRFDALGWSKPVSVYASQYFRSLKPEDAHVRMAVSTENPWVYIAWDERSQKRISWVRSSDGGVTWGQAQPVLAQETAMSQAAPFNIEISAADDTVLMLWQNGEPGSHCIQYSQWSGDGGDHWGAPLKVLDENSACPQSNEIYVRESFHIMISQSLQNSLTLNFWNGVKWSGPQVQEELFSFSNPVTQDAILLDYQQISLSQNSIYLVGCDQEHGGDVWFTTRAFNSPEDWFSPSPAWSEPMTITSATQDISALSYVVEQEDFHAFWIQSSRSELDNSTTSIQYAVWRGDHWLTDTTILPLESPAVQLETARDSEGRLLLLWVDEKSGDLLFSWAQADRANIASEWQTPQNLPSPSPVNSSPDILVDALNRIIVAYAVPINANRGIYILQSTDMGKTWSSPLQAFDGVAQDWEIIDSPKITLSGDGRLHLLFRRYVMRDEKQSVGLFYSQSTNGGIAWSDPEPVSEGAVEWSDIISGEQQTVHRIWQEKNKSETFILDQVSFDGGITWGIPTKITGTSEETKQVSAFINEFGQLFLVQLLVGKNPILQDWRWDGSGWISQEATGWVQKGEGIQYSIAGGVVANRNINVSVLVEYTDPEGRLVNEIVSFSRDLRSPERNGIPFQPILSESEITSISTEPPVALPMSTVQAPLPDTVSPFATFRDNLVGLMLVLVPVILILIIVFSYRKKS